MIDLFPNLTIVPMWLLFAVVFVVLNRLVFGPTLKLIEERKKATDSLTEQANALLGVNQRQVKQYEEALTQARSKASQEREKIIHQAREEERGLIEGARREIECELKILKEKIGQEKGRVLSQLESSAQELAREMVNKVLERKAA